MTATIIAILNRKGGVAKTTTADALAYYLHCIFNKRLGGWSTNRTFDRCFDTVIVDHRVCVGAQRREWQKESGYRQQARVENGFFRYKSVLGGGLKARNSSAQAREAIIGCHILNRMGELGRPESYAVVS